MKHTNSFLPAERVTDSHGRGHWRIALTGADGLGKFALVDDAGLAALNAAGVRQLYLISDGDGRSYVSCMRANRTVARAARIITGDQKGSRVEYISGGKLDLRASNLRVRQYEGVGEPGYRKPRAKKVAA